MQESGLKGIRILDFTQVWAGPYCSLLLALNGAEVIKVESNKRPDQSRLFSVTLGTFFEGKDESPLYNTLNLNKLDITLNLSKPESIKLVKEITAKCDVVVENFRPGVMNRLGIGYDALKEVKPDIIYLSSSSRGGTGPEWNYAGYAPIFAMLSGVSYMTGHAEGMASGLSGRTDLLVGATSFNAILAALFYRSRTGKGQYIDLSSSEAMSVLIGDIFMDYSMNKRDQSRIGNRDTVLAPHNCYKCKGDDNWVSIVVSNEEEWKNFIKALGNPEWANNGKFSDAYIRKVNEDELDKNISDWTSKYTHFEVMEILQKAGVAAMPSFSNEELCNCKHLKEREFLSEINHPNLGKQSVVSPPWKLSETPAKVTRHAPLFGEHNKYVFGELLGMSDEEIEKLHKEEIIY